MRANPPFNCAIGGPEHIARDMLSKADILERTAVQREDYAARCVLPRVAERIRSIAASDRWQAALCRDRARGGK